MTSARHRLDPNDPDADLDGLSSDELEETVFGPDPARPRRATRSRSATRTAPRAASRPTKYCHACAERLDARAELCPTCGVRQPGVRSGRPAKDRTTAAVLALVSLFLGGAMVHKFYLGRTGAGILSLLFFWTGIPWVLSLVHLVRFLTMDDDAFEERYA
ncbi:MAG TPA: TM2 domain-containing protein [Rubricoccaceae bacterium]|jgi:TM2 domain-containing membrane protein YozV